MAGESLAKEGLAPDCEPGLALCPVMPIPELFPHSLAAHRPPLTAPGQQSGQSSDSVPPPSPRVCIPLPFLCMSLLFPLYHWVGVGVLHWEEESLVLLVGQRTAKGLGKPPIWHLPNLGP